jgi:hypothetical protein
MPDADKTGVIDGGAGKRIREHFTVKGNRTVRYAGVRVGRQAGSGNLSVWLYCGGTLRGSGVIPSSAFNTYTIGTATDNGNWSEVDLGADVALNDGASCDLMLTTLSGANTRLSMVPIRYDDFDTINGVHNRMDSYAFREGAAQKSSDNGATWQAMYSGGSVNMQFYLR